VTEKFEHKKKTKNPKALFTLFTHFNPPKRSERTTEKWNFKTEKMHFSCFQFAAEKA